MPEGRRTDHKSAANELLRQQFNSLRDALLAGPIASAAPGLTIGTTADTEVKIATEFTLMVNGVPADVSAQEVAFTATTHDIADPDADPREAVFLFSADAAGNVTITKGTTAAAGAAVVPDVPNGEVAFGKVLIQHDGTAAFVATTDSLDAAHLTVTYTDLASALPAKVTLAGES